MGTTQRSVNLFKRMYQRVKSLFKGRNNVKELDQILTPHKMMTRKERVKTEKFRQYHGARQRQHHSHGGGRVSLNMSNDSIFFPQRKKLKGYERDHATGKKRVA